MGHKPWDLPWRRAKRRRGKQQWRNDAEAQVGLTPLADVISELGLTQEQIDAAED